MMRGAPWSYAGGVVQWTTLRPRPCDLASLGPVRALSDTRGSALPRASLPSRPVPKSVLLSQPGSASPGHLGSDQRVQLQQFPPQRPALAAEAALGGASLPAPVRRPR
eukprot:277690-Alexandrium_andersonii.AAC.1